MRYLRFELCGVALGVSTLEFDTDSKTRDIGRQASVDGLRSSFKELVFDAHVVVEVLDVADSLRCASYVYV